MGYFSLEEYVLLKNTFARAENKYFVFACVGLDKKEPPENSKLARHFLPEYTELCFAFVL